MYSALSLFMVISGLPINGKIIELLVIYSHHKFEPLILILKSILLAKIL